MHWEVFPPLHFFFWKCLRKIVKMFVLPKANHPFTATPIKIPIAYFAEIKKKKKAVVNFVWNYERP